MSENNQKKLCSKENPCQGCQKWAKEELSKCEKWEINKKKSLENLDLEKEAKWNFCLDQNSNNNKTQCSSTGRYNQGCAYENCLKCSKNTIFYIFKFNNYGDKIKSLKSQSCSNCQFVFNDSDEILSRSLNSGPEEEQIEIYMKDNNICQISLTDQGDLLIKYIDQTSETVQASNQQLQQIKIYLENARDKSAAPASIQTNEQQFQPKPTNYAWVIGGVLVIITLLGIIIYFFTKSKGKKHQ